ncbi:MAG: ParB N-terminal domain-containing protein [Sphingomonas sp.]|uniref:ParB N-terminal domain-containing protein n=1 Tax=Sphingomonas sp. TaxID=28214 RepID=UPI00258CC2B4|nr:ParB N-terminal domain-containing protein [Sphingomonas sp.]MCP4028583.1 ParB N-terminal domain-containing protein [Sphingomonas sp.]
MTDEAPVIRLPIALIRRDGGTQIRAQISMDVAREYAEAMGLGAAFPPIGVIHDGTDQWVWDGFHRLMGADLSGATEIDAIVRPGTRRDAIIAALGANAQHGYRRSNADKRNAVITALADDELARKSDREIARICQVGPDMVGRLRPPPPPPSVAERQKPATREVTRGGKTFEMEVAAINRERAPMPEPAPVPPPVKGSLQLRTLLGELRAGADVETAAVVAEIGRAEAREHALAEARGEYADIVAIEPNWRIDGDHLILTLTSGIDDEDQPEPVEPANDDAPPSSFDFAAAQIRDAAVQAISALAKAPPAEDLAAMWAAYTGRGVPMEIVVRARAWLNAFADLFPAAEAARQAAITSKLENI